MTQVEKILQKFTRLPPPKDLTWSELVQVMASFGFEWECSGGSHGAFVNEEINAEIKPAVKPHGKGENVIPAYQIRNYKKILADYGFLS